MRTTVILFLLVFFSVQVYSQEKSYNDLPFVRVYNLEGKKINKGRVLKVTDSSLVLISRKDQVEIMTGEIGKIKTKHSAGSNIFIGAFIGAVALGAAGVATAEPDTWFGYTQGEGAFGGGVLGAAGGGILGWITSLFKNSKTYSIEGDTQKWMDLKQKHLLGNS
ncbi:hypothetical protein [Salinimicrobium soli]|uniref:hypothetical protein n=1 Tax=Salinimicrobium soli TaxID=1254399 RepID=UPI003AADE3C8